MTNILPIKTLSILITSQLGVEFWPYSEVDPYWQEGGQPRDYKWQLTLDVRPQKHSSTQSIIPFEFNGLDINVGDWIANNVTGLALQIVSIASKTRYNATVIAEDINRYNIFRSPGATGSGSIGTGEGIVFDLDSEGEALIEVNALSSLSATFELNIDSRFKSFNTEENFQLIKIAHGFQLDELISADPIGHTFVLATDTTDTIVGKVVLLGPGPDSFYIIPSQRINTFDFLQGLPGDRVYINSSGNLISSVTTRETYIKLRNNTQTIARSNIVDPTMNPSDQFSINRTNISGYGSGNVAGVVSAINSSYSTTKVQAFSQPLPSIMPISFAMHYGEPALYTATPATATIDGVLVTFDIHVQGTATYGISVALASDIAAAINRDMQAASNINIVAMANGSELILEGLLGTAFSITNNSPDINGINFAGSNSGTGFALLSSSTSSVYLKLVADDARAIILQNVIGTPLDSLQLTSSENGIKAAAMVLGVSGGTSSGVINSIKGLINFASATTQSIGLIPANAIIMRVYLLVTVVSTTTTTVSIGDPSNGAASYMDTTQNNTQILGQYDAECFVTNGGTSITANATVTTAGASGSGTVIIEYRTN